MVILKLLFGFMALASDCTALFEKTLAFRDGDLDVSVSESGVVQLTTAQGQVTQFQLGFSIPRRFLNTRFIRVTSKGYLAFVGQTNLETPQAFPNVHYLVNPVDGKYQIHAIHDLPAIYEDTGIELEGVHTLTLDQERPLVVYVTSHHKDPTYFRILVADLESGAAMDVYPVSGGHPLHTRYLGPGGDGLTVYFRRAAQGEGLDLLKKTLGPTAAADALIEIELKGGRFVWVQPMH